LTYPRSLSVNSKSEKITGITNILIFPDDGTKPAVRGNPDEISPGVASEIRQASGLESFATGVIVESVRIAETGTCQRATPPVFIQSNLVFLPFSLIVAVAETLGHD
jgi:hypothetical protein